MRRVAAKVVAGCIGVMGLLSTWIGLALFPGLRGPADPLMFEMVLFMIVYGLAEIAISAMVLFVYSRPSMRCLNAFIGFNLVLILQEPLRGLAAWGLGARGIALDQWAFAGSLVAGLTTYYLLNRIYDRDFPRQRLFSRTLNSAERGAVHH